MTRKYWRIAELKTLSREDLLNHSRELIHYDNISSVRCFNSIFNKNSYRWNGATDIVKKANTLGDLLKINPTEFLKGRNFGKRSLDSLIKFFTEIGLEFEIDNKTMLKENSIVVQRETLEEVKELLDKFYVVYERGSEAFYKTNDIVIISSLKKKIDSLLWVEEKE